MDDNVELTQKFMKAASHVRKILDKFSNDDLLELYAYYKQALEGPCKSPKPWWYDVTAKQKWESWRRLKDMDSESAMRKYVNIVGKADPGWDAGEIDIESNSSTSNNTLWVSVSCMPNTDDIIPDADKTIFDWVKEGNVKKVLESANKLGDSELINTTDSEGMGLVHWAADRGNVEVIKCLVENFGADVNLKDGEGQTALHYAASCGHLNVINFLLQHGGDPNICDIDGTLPADLASDSEISKALTVASKNNS